MKQHDDKTFNASDFAQHSERIADNDSSPCGMFEFKSMNSWQQFAKEHAPSDQLLNELIYEGETTFLIADTGVGKSIFAVQVAEHISGGSRIGGFRESTRPRKTLLVDLEMSPKQQEKRYSEEGQKNHYVFSQNFFRVQLDNNTTMPEEMTFEDWLFQSIEFLTLQHQIEVLIVDNITWLGTELEKAKDAAKLMKGLKIIRDKYKLTLLCLAHTPKRDAAKPLLLNDLAGSKMLANFIDAAFVIGKSTKGGNVRYLKQLKQRNDDNIYHAENVMVFEVIKPTNFLHFNFLCFGVEAEHLKERDKKQSDEQSGAILAMYNEGKSYREIAEALGTSKSTVERTINKNRYNNG